jgi:hypothetical protein
VGLFFLVNKLPDRTILRGDLNPQVLHLIPEVLLCPLSPRITGVRIIRSTLVSPFLAATVLQVGFESQNTEVFLLGEPLSGDDFGEESVVKLFWPLSAEIDEFFEGDFLPLAIALKQDRRTAVRTDPFLNRAGHLLIRYRFSALTGLSRGSLPRTGVW